MTTDAQLLRDYAESGTEQAFSELVKRHLDLVYSTALRLMGGDAHLSEDVAQTVFCDLARKARHLASVSVLSGWLYRHTYFTAAKAVRTERRRRVREKEAATMNALHDDPGSETLWKQIAPLLDTALNQLGTRDRDALILRFFQKQALREVGAALGLTEDAAQKTVARAIEKLRRHLADHGKELSAAALAALMGSHAVSAAPALLTTSITAAALTGSSGAGIALFFSKLMATPKLTVTIIAAATLAGSALVFEHRIVDRLRRENQALVEQLHQSGAGPNEGANPGVSVLDPEELARTRREHSELLKLRGEVSVLRHEARRPKAGNAHASIPKPSANADPTVQSFKATLRSNVPEGQTLVTGGWETRPGKRTVVLVTPHRLDANSAGQIDLETKFFEVDSEAFNEFGLDSLKTGTTDTSQGGLMTKDEVGVLLTNLLATAKADLLSAPRVRTQDGQQAQIAVVSPSAGGPTGAPLGPMVDLVPTLAPDGKSIDLSLVAQINLPATNSVPPATIGDDQAH